MLFSSENIVGRIIKNKINMSQIAANPTCENLKKALGVLEFPAQCIIQEGFWSKRIDLEVTQFFCLTPAYSDIRADYYKITDIRSDSCYKIHKILGKFLSGQQTQRFFIKLGEKVKNNLAGFEDRLRRFEKLVSTPQYKFELTPMQQYFLHKQFPIILVLENEGKISLYSPRSEEYRSHHILKIGQDIKIIATDTHHHRLHIMKYLEHHRINTIQVLLFDELRESKRNHKKPGSPYCHSDGTPSLKWLSARNTSSADIMFFRSKVSYLLDTGYTNSTLNSATNLYKTGLLLEDAQEYQEIDFT